jgi:hypothetical protein
VRKMKWYFKSAIRGIRGWAAKFPNKVRVYRFIQMDSRRDPRDVHLGTGYSAWLICKMIEAGIKPPMGDPWGCTCKRLFWKILGIPCLKHGRRWPACSCPKPPIKSCPVHEQPWVNWSANVWSRITVQVPGPPYEMLFSESPAYPPDPPEETSKADDLPGEKS